jgi:hypothetical protein
MIPPAISGCRPKLFPESQNRRAWTESTLQRLFFRSLLDGAVDFLFMPKDYSMAPFLKTIDTAIMGRKTFDAARKMGAGSFSSSSYVFSILSRLANRMG